MSPTTLLTLSEAARQTGLHRDTLRVQIHNGRLKGEKIGRDWFVSQAALDAYLAQRWTRAKKKPKRGKG